MTNDLYTFISELKNQLKTISSVKRVGEYPYDVKLAEADGNSPMVLIQEGDEDPSELEQNKALGKSVRISVWLYLDMNTIRTKTITDLQSEVETAVLLDSFVDGSTAYCVTWVGVEKGEQLTDYTGYDVGYNNSKTTCKINFDVVLMIAR